jgi:hypothetical protein
MGFSFRLLFGFVSGAEMWMQLFGFPLGISYGGGKELSSMKSTNYRMGDKP